MPSSCHFMTMHPQSAEQSTPSSCHSMLMHLKVQSIKGGRRRRNDPVRPQHLQGSTRRRWSSTSKTKHERALLHEDAKVACDSCALWFRVWKGRGGSRTP
eukprot:1148924-Pelagomonas_calceolata.AAC.7